MAGGNTRCTISDEADLEDVALEEINEEQTQHQPHCYKDDRMQRLEDLVAKLTHSMTTMQMTLHRQHVSTNNNRLHFNNSCNIW